MKQPLYLCNTGAVFDLFCNMWGFHVIITKISHKSCMAAKIIEGEFSVIKQWLSILLVVCLAMAMTACGQKAKGDYDVEVIRPDHSSAPAPSKPNKEDTSDAEPTATPQAGYLVGPLDDIEITTSLADYSAPSNSELKNREQLAFFTQNGKTGVIDFEGNIVIPAEKNVHWCPVCGITNEGETEIYNEKGEVIGSGGHGATELGLYYDADKKSLYVEGEFGILQPWNANTLTTLEPMIVSVVTISDTTQDDPNWKGYSLQQEDHPVSISDATGYMLFKPDGTALNGEVYQEVQRASVGTFAVKKDGLWGYVNQETGEQLVNFLYLDARPFCGDRAAVKTETGWGYISLAGAKKTSMTFLKAASAYDGKAWVKTSDGWGVIKLSDYPFKKG